MTPAAGRSRARSAGNTRRGLAPGKWQGMPSRRSARAAVWVSSASHWVERVSYGSGTPKMVPRPSRHNYSVFSPLPGIPWWPTIRPRSRRRCGDRTIEAEGLPAGIRIPRPRGASGRAAARRLVPRPSRGVGPVRRPGTRRLCLARRGSAPVPDPVSGDYRLGPGDQVRIIVFGDEQLTGEFRVDASGEIGLPLVGSVMRRG